MCICTHARNRKETKQQRCIYHSTVRKAYMKSQIEQHKGQMATLYIWMRVYIYTYVYMCVYVCVCVYIYTYASVYISEEDFSVHRRSIKRFFFFFFLVTHALSSHSFYIFFFHSLSFLLFFTLHWSFQRTKDTEHSLARYSIIVLVDFFLIFLFTRLMAMILYIHGP